MLRGILNGLSGAALGGIFLLLFASYALAQNPPQINVSQLDSQGFPKISTVVTVLDSTGRPITDLTAENFRAQLDGQDSSVTAVQSVLDAKVGIGVVLAIDISGSMAGDPLQQSKAAARAFVEGLAENDRVAVLTFADEVNVVQDFTNDKGRAIAAIDGLQAKGNTALYKGAATAVERAAAAGTPRKAVILLSDGTDFGSVSNISRDDSLAWAKGSGVPVFAIALGNEVDRAYLETLASDTRARYLPAPFPDDLTRLYQDIGRLLRSQYIVTVDVGNIAYVPQHSLKLTVTSQAGSAVTEVTFPSPLPPPTPVIVATPQSVAEPISAPEPQPVAKEEGGFPIVAVALIAALALASFVMLAVLIRRRIRLVKLLQSLPPPIMSEDMVHKTVPVNSGQVLAHLVLRDGPQKGQVFPIGTTPVTIGSDPDCNVVLEDVKGTVAPRQARIWPHEGRFIYHNISRRRTSSVDGQPAYWAVLEPGDEIAIGPHRLALEPATDDNGQQSS